MRLIRSALIGALLTATFASAAHADLVVTAPGVIQNGGIKDVVAAFTKATGVKVLLKSGGMSGVVANAKATGPDAADVIFLPIEPYNLLGNLALDGGLSGNMVPVGRTLFGLAVRKGDPHPDISTPEKFVAVLKGAKNVMRSNQGADLTPGKGSMVALSIYNMLQRPEFAGVHSTASTNGEGGTALGRGEGDMAIQAVCEIINQPDKIELVGVVPAQFYLHMDMGVALGAHANDEKDAKAFIAFTTTPEAKALWKAKGIDPF